MGDPTNSYTTAGIALRVSGVLKPRHNDKVETPSVGKEDEHGGGKLHKQSDIWLQILKTFLTVTNVGVAVALCTRAQEVPTTLTAVIRGFPQDASKIPGERLN
jgi:hypothetical protein